MVSHIDQVRFELDWATPHTTREIGLPQIKEKGLAPNWRVGCFRGMGLGGGLLLADFGLKVVPPLLGQSLDGLSVKDQGPGLV